MNRNRNIVLLIIVLGFLSSVVFILSLFSQASIVLNVAPSTAIIQIDGKKAKIGKNNVAKGKHLVRVTLVNFISQEKTIIVNDSANLAFNLDPANGDGFKYLADHPALQLEREALGGRQFGINSSNVGKRYPFLNSLPIDGQRFSVSRGDAVNTVTDRSTAIALYISASTPVDRQTALLYTKQAGINFSSVEIIYPDSQNLFSPINNASVSTDGATDLASVSTALSNTYKAAMGVYAVKSVTAPDNQGWFAALLVPNSTNYDDYIVILHKVGNNLNIAAGPNITLAYDVYPKVPRGVIDIANHLQPIPGN